MPSHPCFFALAECHAKSNTDRRCPWPFCKPPGFDNWAAGVHRQYTSLGMASPFLGGRIQAHLCTYWCLRWLSRPEQCSVGPYYDLPFSIKKLRSILHFRMGLHALPIEQGRLDRSAVPRHLRQCTFCTTRAVGDERHCLFDCPHFGDLRSEHA